MSGGPCLAVVSRQRGNHHQRGRATGRFCPNSTPRDWIRRRGPVEQGTATLPGGYCQSLTVIPYASKGWLSCRPGGSGPGPPYTIALALPERKAYRRQKLFFRVLGRLPWPRRTAHGEVSQNNNMHTRRLARGIVANLAWRLRRNPWQRLFLCVFGANTAGARTRSMEPMAYIDP